MTFSVMIVTRNRAARLIDTLDQIARLHPQPLEILVCADGCTDDTATLVREKHPRVTLVTNPSPLGSVASRHRILGLAKGDWVLSVDDDSYPLSADFWTHAVELMDAHPEAAVFTFPELRDDGQYSQPNKTPDSPRRYVAAYANCAALMDRKFYLAQPGFPGFFGHMYEEPDYALQCYAAGKSVWFEPSLPFRHHRLTGGRQWMKRHHSNARNELWSVWLRCPLWLLPAVSVFRVLRQFQSAFRTQRSWILAEPLWWAQALLGIPHCLRNRKAVAPRIYQAWLQLPKRIWRNRTQLQTGFPVP